MTIAQFVQTAQASGQRFLQWWIGELVGCLPQTWRSRLAWRQAKQVLIPETGLWVLGRDRSDGSFEVLARFPRGDSAPPTQFHAGQAVTLRLPPELALHKTIRLPLAAIENLREAVSFQLDRYTPFSYEDAYFDCALVQRDDAAGQLLVEATVVARGRVDAVREAAEQLGCRVDAIEIKRDSAAEPKGPIALPVPALGRTPRAQVALTAIAAAVLVSLTVFAALLPLMAARLQAGELAQQLDDARRQAEAAVRLEKENQELKREASFLASRASAHPAALDVLLELTRLTPDDTWLDSVQLTGANVQLAGLSTSASALISRYGQSNLFRNMEFRSPVTPDARSGRERFQISGQIPAPSKP